MSPVYFTGDAFKGSIGLIMTGSTMALSFLIDPRTLFLVLKSTNVFEEAQTIEYYLKS